MNNIILKQITPLIEEITKHSNNRYLAWEHCFKAFNQTKDIELLSLHLASYLASWGMYRGSGQLLQKDYQIHNEAIEIIMKHQVERDDISNILQLGELLKTHYKKEKITPTDTLISKIILGAKGLTPAFDRFFIEGYYHETNKKAKFDKSTLSDINHFMVTNKPFIQECEDILFSARNIYYTDHRIIDMYYWQIGNTLSTKNKEM